jgi:hypothetical protein
MATAMSTVPAVTTAMTSRSVSTTETSAATFTWWPLAGDIYDDCSTAYFRAVEHLNGCFSFFRRRHLNKAKTSLTARCWIKNNPRRSHSACLTKQL